MKSKFVWLLSLVAFISVFSFPKVVKANEDIPYNPDYPKAQYPYAQAPDGCSGLSESGREIRDRWGPVDFTGACNTHDKCYYTYPSDWNTCNERFHSDLRAACERALADPRRNPIGVLGTVLTGGLTLKTCYTTAAYYYGGVQLGVIFKIFKKAQNLQKKYISYTESVIAGNAVPQPTTPTFNQAGYFAYNNATNYMPGNGTYCAFTSPGHYLTFRATHPAPNTDPSSFINSLSYTGACPFAAGYFPYNNATNYTPGDSTYCAFTNPDHYQAFRAAHPAPNPDPAGFINYLTYSGSCPEP
jgi:hypothetical protein